MPSIYSRRIGIEPSLWRMGLALNAGGIGIGIWQLTLPSIVSGAMCIAAPWVAIAVAWFDKRFSLMSWRPDSRADIGGLWCPVVVLAVQAATQQKMMTPLAPLLAAVPFAIFMFVALTKVDFDARVTFRMPWTVALCAAWAWGSGIYANVSFDPSRAVLMSGTVLETHSSRGGRRMTVSSSYAGQKVLLKGLPAGRREIGAQVLIEMKDGWLGWRYLRVLNT